MNTYKAEVTQIFKKGDITSKTNYHPVSTLLNLSKIKYLLQNKFSINLTGFQKNHGTQHALLKMIETSKNKTKHGS